MAPSFGGSVSSVRRIGIVQTHRTLFDIRAEEPDVREANLVATVAKHVGNLVKVRCEECTATIGGVEMVQRRKCDGDTDVGRGTATYLVGYDQRSISRSTQDLAGLAHLYHERASIPRHIVSSADTTEDTIHDAQPCRARRHKRATLGQDGKQSSMSEIRTLASHVRSTDDVKSRLWRQPYVVGLKEAMMLQ